MEKKLRALGTKNIRILIDRLVPLNNLADLPLYGNCFCPFHDDRNKPSAHCYEKDGVVKLWCYQEHRYYGSYDYLKIIKGINPVRYLKDNFPEKDLDSITEILKRDGNLFYGIEESKTNDIHNLWIDSDENVEEFLDSLYFGYNEGDI
jgi:hypothetical protein